MADFVNERYRQQAAQEEQQNQQNLTRMMSLAQQGQQNQFREQQMAMQQAEMQMRQQQMAEAMKEKQMAQAHTMMTMKELPLEMRLQGANQFVKLNGYDGEIRPEHLDSWAGLSTNLVKAAETGELWKYEPIIAEALEKWTTPGQKAEAAQMLVQAQQQRSQQALELANPQPPEAQQADVYLKANRENYLQDMKDAAADRVNLGSGVVGVSGMQQEGKPTDPVYLAEYKKQMEGQGWPEGSPYRVSLTPDDGGVKTAAGPYQETAPLVSGGAMAWTDERDMRIKEYERQQAVFDQDKSRQMINDKLSRALLHDPKGLTALNQMTASRTLGIPFAGVKTKDLIEDRGLGLIARGEDTWSEADRRFMNVYYATHGNTVRNQAQILALQEKEDEFTQKQAVATSTAGLLAQSEFTTRRTALATERASLAKEAKAVDIPAERAQQIMARQAEIGQELGVMGAAEDETAKATLGQLQALSQSQQVRTRQLNEQLSRTPAAQVPLIRDQITQAKSHADLYGQLFQTLSTYSTSEFAKREDQLATDHARLERIDLHDPSLDEAAKKELSTEREQLVTSIKDGEAWLKTAGEERAKAHARISAHAEVMKRAGARTSSAIELAKRKEQNQADSGEAINAFLSRINDHGEDPQTALKIVTAEYPLAKSADLLKANEEVNKSRNETQLPLAQSLYLARNRGAEPNPKLADEIRKQFSKKAPKLTIEQIMDVKGPKGAGGGLDFKDYQQGFDHVLNQAAKLSGQSGMRFSTSPTGEASFEMGTVKDPLALADRIEELTSAQAFLPDIVKQALSKTVVSLRKAKGAAAPAAPPTTPAPNLAVPNPADAEQRLRDKYLK
jgi:hypothetical protein